MAPLEVEVTIHSAKNLKNVNWSHGDLKPYAVLWVDPSYKCSTCVDDINDTDPIWEDKLTISLRDLQLQDSTLCIDVVHANASDDTKPLVCSTRLPLSDVVDEVGLGKKCPKTLELKRPSGRPQGKLEVEVEVRDLGYHAPPPAAYAPPYGQASRDYPYAPAYRAPLRYAAPAPAPPPSGYPYNPYGQQPYGQQPAYVQQPYGQQPAYVQQPAYGSSPVQDEESEFGVGTGLAVGAVGGLVGGLAIAEGVDSVEDKIADSVAEKVEDDLDYDGGDFGGDDF